MDTILEKKLYLDGIHLFNTHEYFEAHETWEDIWHMAYGLKHEFYQGMIQAAVALEHYRRSNPRGVVSLFKSYPPKFRNVPERFMGMNVKWFLGAMERVLRPVMPVMPISPMPFTPAGFTSGSCSSMIATSICGTSAWPAMR